MKFKTQIWTVALMLICSVAATAGPPPTDFNYKLRVTSATPGTEIEFEVAYMFNGTDPAIHYVKQQTPFEVSADGELAMGMFRSIAETGQIKVEIDSFVGDEEGPAASASNDGVVFGDNVVDCASPFIHAFKLSVVEE